MSKHIQTKHSVNPQFACSLCNKQFSTRANAKYHIENGHVEFLCPVCDKTFKNKSHAQRHIDNLHVQKTKDDLATAINQADLKPLKRSKKEPELIDISTKYNKNMTENNPIIQNFETTNTFLYDSGVKTDGNNNMVNFNYDRNAYPNIIWSNPSISSVSPNSACLTQSPINHTSTNLYFLNNNNINQQSLNENVSLSNQSFFI